jgi:hypothetical protein
MDRGEVVVRLGQLGKVLRDLLQQRRGLAAPARIGEHDRLQEAHLRILRLAGEEAVGALQRRLDWPAWCSRVTSLSSSARAASAGRTGASAKAKERRMKAASARRCIVEGVAAGAWLRMRAQPAIVQNGAAILIRL